MKKYQRLGSMTYNEAKKVAENLGLEVVKFQDGSYDVE
jgi:hypothetical protein